MPDTVNEAGNDGHFCADTVPAGAIDQRARNDAELLAKIKDEPPERFKALREGIERDGYVRHSGG